MSNYIACPECGNRQIGKYKEFFDRAKEALFNNEVFNNEKYGKIDINKLCFSTNITPSLEIIYDAIGLKNRCCRMHISTPYKFDKQFD